MASNCLIICTIFLSITGIMGDILNLGYTQTHNCKDGLIAKVDEFSLTGTICPSNPNHYKTRNVIDFTQAMKGDDRGIYIICNVDISVPCNKVKGKSRCVCKDYSNGTFQFYLNMTAENEDSESSFKLSWRNEGFKPRDYSNIITLPKVYAQEQSTMFVGRTAIRLDSCEATIKLDEFLLWCVYSLANHTLAITFDFETITSTTDCVKYVTKPSIYNAKSFHFNVSYEEHSGCMRNKSFTCQFIVTSEDMNETNDVLILGGYTQTQHCKAGLIANVDKYSFTATIRLANPNQLRMRYLIFFIQSLKTNYNARYDWCGMYINVPCNKTRADRPCFCKDYSNGTFQFYLNMTARHWDSESMYKLAWPISPGVPWWYSNNITLPKVYTLEQSILLVGRKVLDPEKCEATFNVYETLRWCVYNLANHTLAITYDFGSFTSTTDCVEYPTDSKFTWSSHFNASYEEHSGCMRNKTFTCRYSATFEVSKSTNGCNSLDLMSIGWIIFMMTSAHSAIGILALPVVF